MFEVIKGSSPAHTIVIDGDVKIGVSSKKTVNKVQSEQGETSGSEERASDSNLITMTQEELDSIRAQYRMDGEQYAEEMRIKTGMELARAKSEAEKIVEMAEQKSSEILAAAEDRVKLAEEEGRKQGYEDGYREGSGKGAEDGYTQSVREGRAALQELQNLCNTLEKERNELMAENRRAIFDLSMGIAQKITMTVLNQKDKSVLQKMITNAAKEFRKAKRIKVTLSRFDLSEDVETDLKTFERCFSPSSEVEFEILEDGEKGTLQIETDTEILDAGVSTQLRMIEELGSGKYRDKEPEKFAEDGEERAMDINEELFEEQPEEKTEEKPEVKAEAKTEVKSEGKSRKRTKAEAKKSEKSEDTDSLVSWEVPVTEDEDAE